MGGTIVINAMKKKQKGEKKMKWIVNGRIVTHTRVKWVVESDTRPTQYDIIDEIPEDEEPEEVVGVEIDETVKCES